MVLFNSNERAIVNGLVVQAISYLRRIIGGVFPRAQPPFVLFFSSELQIALNFESENRESHVVEASEKLKLLLWFYKIIISF